MQEKTWQRVGIGASIVGAVAGLAFLLKKGGGTTVVTAGTPYSPTPGMVESSGTQGVGIPGPPGQTGAPGETGATGSQAGLAAAAGPVTTFPTPQSLNQYFVSQFFDPSNGMVPRMASNVSPSLDQSKMPDQAEGGNGSSQSGGCGCGSKAAGGGCGGGRCPNQPPPLRFPDGAGACASTTVRRLQLSMDRCVPENLQLAALNMMGNVQYGTNPDPNLFFAAVQRSLHRGGSPIPTAEGSMAPNHVGPSRFGLS